MQTFKEFMLQLPEEVMPDEAKGAYRQYQAEFWGSEIRADFELHKNEQWWALPGMLGSAVAILPPVWSV